MSGRKLAGAVLGGLLVGCVEVPVVVDPGGASSSMVGVGTLRGGSLASGTMLVGPLRMTTGLAEDHLTAFAQDPETGAGVELLMGEALDGWPPAVGTPFKVRGYFAGLADAPVVWVSSMKDVTVLGEPEPLVVLDGNDLPPSLSLARWDDVTVWTRPDPAGRAELSVRRESDGRFGRFVPDAGNVGALLGIVQEDGSVAPRSSADWTGTRDAHAPLDSTLSQVLTSQVAPGELVRVSGVQVAPWTIGGRYTVIQDDAGRGLWVDAEAWSPWAAQVGKAGVFEGLVVVTAGTWQLRSWTAPVWDDTPAVAPVESGNAEHGAWVSLVVSGIQAPDARGDRRVDGDVVLDDRFQALDAVQDGWTVSGVVDLTLGDPRLAVVEATVPLTP